MFSKTYSDFIVLQVQNINERLKMRSAVRSWLSKLKNPRPGSHHGQNRVLCDLKIDDMTTMFNLNKF